MKDSASEGAFQSGFDLSIPVYLCNTGSGPHMPNLETLCKNSIWCSNTKHITAKRRVGKTKIFLLHLFDIPLKFELYRVLSSKIDIWRDTNLTESILRSNFNQILLYCSAVKCSKHSFMLIVYLTVLRVIICLLAVCLLTGSFSSRLCRFQRL